MPARTDSPYRSRQQQERTIKRTQSRFDYGVMRQEDVEGIDVGLRGLSDGVNARLQEKRAHGRGGSELLTPADFSVTLGGSESLATAMQTGELYAASGRDKDADTVPDTGDIFMTLGESDFTGLEMATSKGDDPRKYDIWYIVNSASGSEAIRYLGNIRLPAKPGYGDTSSTEYTASKSGTTITKTAGTNFTSDLIGHYFAWYDGTRDLIDAVPSTTTLTVRSSGTVASATKGKIQMPINGSMFHRGLNKLVFHLGNRIYVSRNFPICGYDEVVGIFDERVSNGASKIFPFDDDAILVTGNGIYFIHLTALLPVYWKMNSGQPLKRIDDIVKTGDKEYKFRYTYTGVRLIGNDYRKDRFNVVDGVYLKKETGPTKRNENSIDYGERWMTERIGDGSTTYGKITGAALTGSYDTPGGWNTIADGELGVVVNSNTYAVAVDLTAVKTLSDVAYYLQLAIRVHEDLSEVVVKLEDGVFILETGEGDSVTYATAGTGGTDISAALGWTSGAGAAISDEYWGTPHVVESMYMPRDARDITHYGVYRTRNCAELETSEHVYTWVADVPVANPITASIDQYGNLTITKGKLRTMDEGCILVGQDGMRVQVDDSTSGSETVISEDGSAYNGKVVGSQSWGIGGGTVFTASQSAKVITVASGKSFAAGDVGKQIFWADGEVSIIDEVSDSIHVVAVSDATHASQAAHIDPISRNFKDTVSDDNITAGRYSSYPLQNRFWEPLPSGDVALLQNQYLFTSSRGGNKYQYSMVAEKYLAGFHHPGYQIDKTIVDGIQAMKPVPDGVLIKGSADDYLLPITTGYEVGDSRVGETCIQLESPRIVARGVGSVGDGGCAGLEDGGFIGMTAEPAIRKFDGNEYGDNLAGGKIQLSDIVNLKQNVAGGYQRNCGYYLFGEQET